MRGALKAQVEMAPEVYSREAEYRPRYTELDLMTLANTLRGTGGQPGVLAQYEQDIAPAIARQEQAQRESELGMVESLGDRARAAYEQGAPEQAALGRQLAGIASADLSRDDILDPGLRREAQQAYRQAATARGIAYSPSSAAEEAYFTGLRAEQLRNQRRAFAGNVYGMLSASRPDVYQALLGRPASVTGAVPSYGGQAMAYGASMGPKLFQPESQAAFDLARAGYQGQVAGRVGQSQARGAMMGGLFQGLGSMARASF
tara:strand:+ start:468 stop:1247 length:780 start_codon:yes stop_codon:yes gene_type:complete